MDFLAMADVLEAQAASLRRHAAAIANEGQASLRLGDEAPWIDWAGGDEPPVPGATLVEISTRQGVSILPANAVNWAHNGGNFYDVLAYRLAAVQPE